MNHFRPTVSGQDVVEAFVIEPHGDCFALASLLAWHVFRRTRFAQAARGHPGPEAAMSRVLYRQLIQLSQLCIHELVRKFGIAVIVGATAPPISIGIAIRPLIVTQQNQNRFGCGGCLEMDGDLPVLSRIDSGRCSVTLQFPKNPFRRCFRRRADFRISFIGNLFVKLGQLLHRIRKPRRTLIELFFGGGPLNLRIQRNRLKTRTETMPYGMRRNE